MELKCGFSKRHSIYTCIPVSASITQPNTTIKEFAGQHKPEKSHADIKSVYFFAQVIEYVPRGLHNIFHNLTSLKIRSCNLKEITREDLVGLEALEELDVEGNLLVSLPGDLFQGMQKLKKINFDENRLARISSKLLEPLLANAMSYAGFSDNTNIDSFFCHSGLTGSVGSMEELMNIIENNCGYTTLSYEDNFKNGSKRLWESSQLSDFTINVDEEHFYVHKSILAIHSSVFMAMFFDNRMKESLEGAMTIEDFTKEVVGEFLRYIYTSEIPDEKFAMDLFAIAAKYNVPKLKSECELMVLKNTNKYNGFEVLALGNLYASESMKKLGFSELQKFFSGHDIPNEMINQPERLKELVELQRELNSKFAEL